MAGITQPAVDFGTGAPVAADALVLLAKHSNLAASSLRHAAPIRETVKSTFSEFKRTHAETWDFIRPLFTTDQLDASAAPRPSPRASFFATVRRPRRFADVLTTGDYLV